MRRGLIVLLCAFTFAAGCSRGPERAQATAPTARTCAPEPGTLLGSTSVAPGGVSGTYDVAFPGRDQSFDFRNQLETKYATGLGRAADPTFVDREGEVVWTQEYIRYRVNGCDHGTATQRVLTQIDGQPAGQICSSPAGGLIEFPPRTDSFDFRRQLESRYQQFLRGASSSAVDAEGGVIWTQEYLRYRANQCDHSTSIQKVFSQIDGGGISPTCYVPPCIYTISPATQAVTEAGGTFTLALTRTSGDCAFTAESLESFVTISSGTSGNGTSTITYAVGRNFGGARSGRIRVRWANTSAILEINQAAGTTVAFTMTDPNAGSGATTNCAIRTASTPCEFSVSSGVFSSSAVYTWHIEYQHGNGMGSHDITSTSSTFRFTQACGVPDGTAAGNTRTLSVTLTVTDGNSTTTVQSGAGGQPSLFITYYTC